VLEIFLCPLKLEFVDRWLLDLGRRVAILRGQLGPGKPHDQAGTLAMKNGEDSARPTRLGDRMRNVLDEDKQSYAAVETVGGWHCCGRLWRDGPLAEI